MSLTPDPERLADCAGCWLQMPPDELAYVLVAESYGSPERPMELSWNWRVYHAVRGNVDRYERGRLALLSRLVRS